MMQTLLEEIADIHVGLTLRGEDASGRPVKGGLHLLRISDLTESGEIEIDTPHPIRETRTDIERFKITPGDIVVANRGTRTTAAIIPEGMQAIASGQLFIVRLKSGRVSADYLHWFLDQKTTQDYLLSLTRGTYVKTLSIVQLKELEIPIPPLETQSKITELVRLSRQETRLLEELAEKRSRYIDGVIKTILKD